MTDDSDLDDAALLRAHVAGDPEAFSTLVRRHRDRLWAVSLRTTCDASEAEDALQDALVSAFRRAETFRGDAQVTTWLHRIVVNSCLDRLRRRNARATEPLPDEERAPVLADERGIGSAVEDSERRTDVMAALAQISPEQRAALVLVDMEGYSMEDAAAILGCRPGTVKSRCSRGRLRLVPLLTQYGGNRESSGSVEPTSSSSEAKSSTPTPNPSGGLPQ